MSEDKKIKKLTKRVEKLEQKVAILEALSLAPQPIIKPLTGGQPDEKVYGPIEPRTFPGTGKPIVPPYTVGDHPESDPIITCDNKEKTDEDTTHST